MLAGSAGPSRPENEVIVTDETPLATAEIEVLDPLSPERRPSRRPLVLVGCLVVVACAVGAVAVLAGSPGPTPEDRFAAARAFLASATGYTYEVAATDVLGMPGDGPGSTTTMRTSSSVEVVGPDRWRVVADYGDFADETIRIDGDVWYRDADAVDDLGAELWAAGSVDELVLSDEELAEVLEDPEEWGLGPVDAFFATISYGSDPATTVELITGATAAELVAEDAAGVTLALRPELPADVERDVDVRLELDLGTDDVPTALRIDASADDASSAVEIRFTGWDVEVAITEPPADMIDPTPWVDEDAVRGYADSAILAPTVLPAGWELSIVEVYSEHEALEGCAQLSLYYEPVPADPADDDAWDMNGDYLDLYTLPADCALDYDDTPFTDQPEGPPSRFRGAELLFGDTVIQLDTTLTGDDLDAAVASLAPVDVEALLAAFVARQAELDELYGT